MIPIIAPIKVHTTKYAKTGHRSCGTKNDPKIDAMGFFIAWTPLIPKFYETIL